MGSYTFRWEHPAQEVFVTGNFDDWTKSVHLQHNGQHFEKTVDLPDYVSSYEKILYKFVVDGHWTADYSKYHENDGSGNINNILFQHDLTQKSQRTAQETSQHESQQQEEEHHMPGEFPETPAPGSDNFFGVSPLPAFSSRGNPTNIAPGQSLPHHSEFTSNTVHSNVTHDRESYERSDAYPSSDAPTMQTGIFGVPPLSVNSNIQSSGAGTSTAELAGQAPREPRGVPQVVQESQQRAHQEPEASANTEAVMEKKDLERELLSKIPTEQGESQSARDFTAGGHVPYTVKHSAQIAHVDPEAAANPSAVDQKDAMETELLQRVHKEGAATGEGSVPSVVRDSQQQAHQSPEASANPEAVSEKEQMEQELTSKVSPTNTQTDTSNTQADTGSKIGDYAVAGAAAVGLTGVAATIEKNMQTSGQNATSTTSVQDVTSRAAPALESAGASISNAFHSTVDKATNAFGNITGTNAPAENVPEPVQHSIAQQYTRGPEAASNPQAVTEKSVMERELLSNMGASGQSQGAAAAVPEVVRESMSESSRGPEAAAYPEAVSEKSAVERELMSSIHQSGASQGSSHVPEVVQESFSQSSRGPEAAANPEAVDEKSAVERELMSSVHQSGASHGSSHVPEVVQDSFSHSSRGPEAAANPEAVDEKSAVESELLRAVRPTNESGEPAPSNSAALSATAPGAEAAVVPGMGSAGSHAPHSSRSEPMTSPALYDNDTAPAINAMQRDLNLSERPTGSTSNTYSSPPQTTSTSQYSAPPAQSYSAHQQSVIDRVFGASVDNAQTFSSARSVESAAVEPVAAAPVVAAPVSFSAPAPVQEMRREVEQPKAAPFEPVQEVKREVEQPKAAPSKPLSSYASVQNQTFGGNTLAFKHDPISASSGSAMSHTSTATTSDPRRIATAFAQDPVSATPIRSSSLAGAPGSKSAATSTPLTSAAPAQSSRKASNPAAMAASAAARSGGGLNAPASHPAQTPATEVTSSSTKPISMPKTLRAPAQDSRDVSPTGGAVSQPTVTTGVATHNTPARSSGTPSTSQPGSSTSTPSKATQDRPEPGRTSSDKTTKRKSFFGKLKEKIAGNKEDDDDEFDGNEDGDELEVEEEGDSGFEDGITGSAQEVEPLLQNDGANDEMDGKKELGQDVTAPKHDIKINLEQKQEPDMADTVQTVKETAGGVVQETKRKVNSANHRNGASFMAACLVAAAAIVLVWGRK